MFPVIWCLIVNALAVACSDGQTNCAAESCETINGVEICTQCTEGNAPIDGSCVAHGTANAHCKGEAADLTAQSQICEKCEGSYFLYKHGCYQVSSSLGTTLCALADGGVCTKGAPGYFALPEAAPTEESVAPCNATAEITLANGKKYLGVDMCTKCADPSAALNTEAAVTVTCAACTPTHVLIEDLNECRSADGCILPGCNVCSEDKKTCAECIKGKFLTPTKEACLSSCPAGSYTSRSACSACDPSCATCTQAGADKCTSCYPGSALVYSTDGSAGTCIPECTGAFAEHCAANSCTGKIGGSNYCVKCDNGYAPIDGVCTAVGGPGRAASACTPGDGVCTACTGDYYLLSGGCYQTTKLPGSSVCSEATANKCTTCVNGQQANSGACPACPDNCVNCATATNSCDICFSGYYLDSTAKACKKCSETSGNIQGVENCISCLAPTSPSIPTPVTCYVMQEPSVNPTDPSANKGGLSSGAIAGISVAVIAVVGGLVGFLCWWFVCRGKA